MLAIFPAFGEPFTLDVGQSLSLTCSTQSVVMLPAAAGSHGEVTLKLDRKADGAPGGSVWFVTGVSADHTLSFGVRDKARCVQGCEFNVPETGRIELWSPKKVGAGSLPEGEALTVIAIDPTTAKLTATTVLGKEIAAFEQGTCKAAP